MQRCSGPTTKAFVFKSDVSFRICPKFELPKKYLQSKMGQSIQMGTRPCPLSFVLSCKKRERESRRRRLSDGKRATRRFNWSSSNAPLCQRTFCTPTTATSPSLRNGAVPVAGLALRAICKEFAPRRSNHPELLLQSTFNWAQQYISSSWSCYF